MSAAKDRTGLPPPYSRAVPDLEFVCQRGVFDGHVLEFAGVKDFATFEALDELGVFLPGHNLYTRMLTFSHHKSLLGELSGPAWNHKSLLSGRMLQQQFFALICRIFSVSSKSCQVPRGKY